MTCIAFVGIGTRPCQPQPSRPRDAGSILVPPKSDGNTKRVTHPYGKSGFLVFIGAQGIGRFRANGRLTLPWDYFMFARHPAAGGREPPNRAFPCSGCWTTVAGPVADSTVRAPRG